ncbi:DgyrCDS8379 [Dimorphilus gyrociliatus]|uniref:DgyrCDS8379 n=1 Tax=Dimorphilus gyrociliatus TaxID=2664684 RepID=A0A7I8VU25_9ANNE|nr:DgyrCDS8379 [Dimorphilus gyrociliatus]
MKLFVLMLVFNVYESIDQNLDLKLYVSEMKTRIGCFSDPYADRLDDTVLECPPLRYVFVSRVFYGVKEEFNKCTSKLKNSKEINCGTEGLEFTLNHYCGGKQVCRLEPKHSGLSSLIGIPKNPLWKGLPAYKRLADSFCKIYNHAEIHYHCVGAINLANFGQNLDLRFINDIDLIFRSTQPLVFDFSQTFGGLLRNPLKNHNGCYDKDMHMIKLKDMHTGNQTIVNICDPRNSIIKMGLIVRLIIVKRFPEVVDWHHNIPKGFTCNKTCRSSHFVYITKQEDKTNFERIENTKNTQVASSSIIIYIVASASVKSSKNVRPEVLIVYKEKWKSIYGD